MIGFVAFALALANIVWGQALSLSPQPKGAPGEYIAVPLLPAWAHIVNRAGQAQAVTTCSPEMARAQYGGYPSAGVPQEGKLEWRLAGNIQGSFYVYFLVRTGHQLGYEYLHAYIGELQGRPIEMQLEAEFPPLRVFHSAQGGWGHDIGWLRSAHPLQLQPGQRLTLSCTEPYAYVSLCLLVPAAVQPRPALRELLRVLHFQLEDYRLLRQRVGEIFPDLQKICEQMQREWQEPCRQFTRFQKALLRASEKRLDGPQQAEALQALSEILKNLHESVKRAEEANVRLLGPALARKRQELWIREAKLRLLPAQDFAGREAEYARSVAQRYLQAAERLRTPRTEEALERLATYCWRAAEFLAQAEEKRQRAPKEPSRAVAKAFVPPLKPHPRQKVLLNGVWELSLEGTAEAPPQGGWLPVPVPHGDLKQAMGHFVTEGHYWPPRKNSVWLRTRFTVPKEMAGGAIFLCFDAVFHLCEAYVNGVFVGRHIGGFDRFEFEITPYVQPGAEAELLCYLYDTSYTALSPSPLISIRAGFAEALQKSSWLQIRKYEGWLAEPNHYVVSDLWGGHFLGIWQDVSLESRAPVWTEEVLIMPSVRQHMLRVRTRLQALPARAKTKPHCAILLRQEVLTEDGQIVLRLPERKAKLAAEPVWLMTQKAWAHPKLWGIGGVYGEPQNLYILRTRLYVEGQGEPIDVRYDRFGFREFWIEKGQFWLNGQRLPLQGGGSWYLQESKLPHGNRWWALRFYGLERGMNVNIERWHRQGDVGGDLLAVADELGMLNELEAPYWGVYGIPDIIGREDWDDPVWTENVTGYYQHLVRKRFNHPSVVLWSVENETFIAPVRPEHMLRRFFAFGQAIKQEDPTRPVTYHAIANGGYVQSYPEIEIVNWHYASLEQLRDWQRKWGGRPCILGEFQNYELLGYLLNNRRDVAREYMGKLQAWIEETWQAHKEIGLSGALYFLPYTAGLVSTARPEWMGPWGDKLEPVEKARVIESGLDKGRAVIYAKVPILWPSRSGPGIKCDFLHTGLGHVSLINWFDPKRPAATPTPVAETLRRCWQPMPELSAETAPEVIVTVTSGGQPAPGLPVVAIPVAGQPASITGAITDSAGTAWLVLPATGAYEIRCGSQAVRWEARRLSRHAPPGWAHIPRLSLALD